MWPLLTKLTNGANHWYLIVAYPKAGKIVTVDSIKRVAHLYDSDLKLIEKALNTHFNLRW